MFNIFKKTTLQPLKINTYVQELHDLCLTSEKEANINNRNFKKAFKLLRYLVTRINSENVYIHNVSIIIWSSIACTYHFYNQMSVVSYACEWRKRKYYTKSLEIYKKFLKLFMNEMSQYVINSIITYITECRLWKNENFCQKLLENLLFEKKTNEKCITYLISLIESQIKLNIDWARLILRILYGLLQAGNKISSTSLIIFLQMFKKSIAAKDGPYLTLRKGLEVCLKRVIDNISNPDLLITLRTMITWIFDENITDECLLDFGNVLEYAAMLHKTGLYQHSLTEDLFPLILKLISSENRLHSLLGNRILQHILDRHDNRFHFKTPQLFTQDTTIEVKIAEYETQDRTFIKNYRELLHDTLILSIIRHGIHRLNLETTYTSIALIIVEIPCGFTAAAIVCLALNIQQYTLMHDFMSNTATHRLHATVVSIVSLICWVHKATVFYQYVNEIIRRRAEYAPQLNPPLKSVYQYAQHHILWNKKDLFLDDWEARYGLWKCFRSRHLKNVLLE